MARNWVPLNRERWQEAIARSIERRKKPTPTAPKVIRARQPSKVRVRIPAKKTYTDFNDRSPEAIAWRAQEGRRAYKEANGNRRARAERERIRMAKRPIPWYMVPDIVWIDEG